MALNGRIPRILFLQLPLIDPLNASAGANVPLAAGYLIQALRSAGIEADAAFLPQETVCYGTDGEIARALSDAEPDILACSCYMWNIERTLFLSGRLKEKLPLCQVWLGGPEIQRDTPWLDDARADCFFIGEGEAAFVGALRDSLRGQPPKGVVSGRTADLGTAASPFAAGILPPGLQGQALLETMRGCRSRCRYCYYGKSFTEQRLFPDTSIQGFFSWATEAGVREIYLMDPALDQHPDFGEFLDKLRLWNPAGIPLHAELKAESVNPEIALKLASCGIKSVEVGLQSVNPRALKSAQRSFNRGRFIDGATALSAIGIEVRTGIILGLPDDDLDGFRETLDFVAAAGLSGFAEVYPLSVLPGTSFREDARSYGLEYLPLPPYTVIGARGWSLDDFSRAQELVEDILGKGLYSTIIPRFGEALGVFKRWATLSDLADPAFRFTSSLSILAGEADLRRPDLIDAAARRFREENGYGAAQIVISSGGNVDAQALDISERFFDPIHYLERFHIHAIDPQGRFSVRLFQLTSDAKEIRRLMHGDGFCEPIYRIRADSEPDAELLSEWSRSSRGPAPISRAGPAS